MYAGIANVLKSVTRSDQSAITALDTVWSVSMLDARVNPRQQSLHLRQRRKCRCNRALCLLCNM